MTARNAGGTSATAATTVTVIFGDTRAEDPKVNLGAVDPIGFSTTTDGDAPLMLRFYRSPRHQSIARLLPATLGRTRESRSVP